MLVLFETAAGYAIFKLKDDDKLKQSDNLYRDFESPEAASKVVNLLHFQRFEDTTEALATSKALIEGKLSKSLKKTLRGFCQESQKQLLAVADAKLGKSIAEKLNLSCIWNTPVQELMRCIKTQMHSLLGNINKKDMTAMSLGLAHSLSRYKIKFSSDKIDTMVIQAICVLDELDKQINNYIMRAREWFGWHFPELGKILKDNFQYIRTMQCIGMRENVVNCDVSLSAFLSEDQLAEVMVNAETSMGSEITDFDAEHMKILCEEILELDRYRSDLKQYLARRMMVLAPNLTILVGDVVGARLISKAGSLRNLAKHPASTLQILGAEKALFRALKARKNTPKYGLIYHAELVASAPPKNKGKASRMLAAKASLATRFDALGETSSTTLGTEHMDKLRKRLKVLESGRRTKLSGTSEAKARFERYRGNQEYKQYSASVDSTLPKKLDSKTTEERTSKKKKTQTLKQEPMAGSSGVKEANNEANNVSLSKKKKKRASEQEPAPGPSGVKIEVEDETNVSLSKKKKKHTSEQEPVPGPSGVKIEVEDEANVSLSKKKKKHALEQEPVPGPSGAKIDVEDEANVSLSKKKKKHALEQEPVAGFSGVKIEVEDEANVSLSKKKKKHALEQEPVAGPSGVKIEIEDETNVSLSKKKKKHSLERTPDTGKSSGAQTEVKEEADVSLSKKKKKREPDTTEFSGAQAERKEEEADMSLPKKKKKKHSLERPPDEQSGAQAEVKEEADVSVSKKKKKKHSLEREADAGEASGVQATTQVDSSSPLKKKTKHSLEPVSGQSSSSNTQDESNVPQKRKIEEDSELGPESSAKKKKKKKHSLEADMGEVSGIQEKTPKKVASSSSPKKKKDTVPQTATEDANVQRSPSDELKKKKKKK